MIESEICLCDFFHRLKFSGANLTWHNELGDLPINSYSALWLPVRPHTVV